jgi:hypothetical protein
LAPTLNPISLNGNLDFAVALSNPVNASLPLEGSLLGATPVEDVVIQEKNNAGAFRTALPSYAITKTQSVQSLTVHVLRTGGLGTVTIGYSTHANNARPVTDYQDVSGTLTFNQGDTDHSFAIPIEGAGTPPLSLPEDLEIRLTKSPVSGSLAASVVLVTIKEPASPPLTTMQLSAVTVRDKSGYPQVTVLETGKQAVITVTRTGPGTVAANNIFSTLNFVTPAILPVYTWAYQTATPGVDFEPVSGQLVFAPGDTSKSIIVPILDPDTVRPAPRELFIAFCDPATSAVPGCSTSSTWPSGGALLFPYAPPPPSAAVALAPFVHVVINQDQDVEGTISLGSLAFDGSVAQGFARITVNRTGGTAAGASATLNTLPYTAINGVNYTPINPTITFGSGQMTQTVDIPLLAGPPGLQFLVYLLPASADSTNSQIGFVTLTP